MISRAHYNSSKYIVVAVALALIVAIEAYS